MRLGYAGYCLTVTPNLPPQSNLKPEQKLEILRDTINWNVAHDLLLLQLEPELIPLGRIEEYKIQLLEISGLIKKNNIRVIIKPTFLTTLISPDLITFQKSLIELDHLSQLLQFLGLDRQHKIVINIGGLYNDKAASVDRFIQRIQLIQPEICQYLALENDRLLFSLVDCVEIGQRAELPVVFNLTNSYGVTNGESIVEAIEMATATWQPQDGLPIVIYRGAKAPSLHKPWKTIDLDHFKAFFEPISAQKIDLFIDFKDKESSLLKVTSSFKIPN